MPIVEWKRIRPWQGANSIEKFELANGVTMSKALKDVLSKYNGGYPKPSSIKLPNGEEYDVKTLLSFNEGDPESIYQVISFFKTAFKGTLVPFAKDSADNYFCEQNGKIVLWIQENGDIQHVCDGISQFIDKLTDI